MIHHLWQSMRQQKKDLRLQPSSLEARRRAIRFRIITAAEALWEGRDPFPVEVINLETGAIQLVPRLGMPDATKYSIFRSRFAPTKKLKDFLFSPSALSNTPVKCQEKAWLNDPTRSLRSNQQFADVSDDWISSQASLMLGSLTNWQHQQYSLRGMGGAVDSWKEAAMSWHLARLEKEIESGAVYKGTYITSAMSRAKMDRYIRRLKTLLGCNMDDMQELPSLPDRGTSTTPEKYQQFLHNEEIIRERERSERERQKIFNKLVRETCCSCPENAMLFFPMGLEGLCKHCLDCHPRLFWETDFHCLA
jgi:hypothetical protein